MQKLFVVLLLLLLSSGALAQQASVSLEPDTDRPGQNLRVLDLEKADPSLCAQACVQEPQCLSFTYVKPGIQGTKARCWLKAAVPTAKPSNCCISGVKTAGATQSQSRAPQKMIQGEVKISPKSVAGTSKTPSTGGQPTPKAQTFERHMSSQSYYPYTTREIFLEVDGEFFGQFRTCSGIGSMTEIAEHMVAAPQGQQVIKKMPGRTKWLDVTLKRGITSNMSVWKWRQQMITGDIQAARKNFSIVLTDTYGNQVERWNFSNGWPSKVEFSTAGEITTGVMLIESLVITHEGMERVK
jgi:phage tail-like protein